MVLFWGTAKSLKTEACSLRLIREKKLSFSRREETKIAQAEA
jgi:hypothetical protein